MNTPTGDNVNLAGVSDPTKPLAQDLTSEQLAGQVDDDAGNHAHAHAHDGSYPLLSPGLSEMRPIMGAASSALMQVVALDATMRAVALQHIPWIDDTDTQALETFHPDTPDTVNRSKKSNYHIFGKFPHISNEKGGWYYSWSSAQPGSTRLRIGNVISSKKSPDHYYLVLAVHSQVADGKRRIVLGLRLNLLEGKELVLTKTITKIEIPHVNKAHDVFFGTPDPQQLAQCEFYCKYRYFDSVSNSFVETPNRATFFKPLVVPHFYPVVDEEKQRRREAGWAKRRAAKMLQGTPTHDSDNDILMLGAPEPADEQAEHSKAPRMGSPTNLHMYPTTPSAIPNPRIASLVAPSPMSPMPNMGPMPLGTPSSSSASSSSSSSSSSTTAASDVRSPTALANLLAADLSSPLSRFTSMANYVPTDPKDARDRARIEEWLASFPPVSDMCLENSCCMLLGLKRLLMTTTQVMHTRLEGDSGREWLLK